MRNARQARRLLCRLALVTGAVLLVAARPARHSVAHPVAHPVAARTNLVTVTPAGAHLLGDPAAKVRLTEYISYTCSHCAHFHAEADPTLRTGFVATGKASVEVVPYIRNSIDMAAALLVDCGAPAKFIGLHDGFLDTQTQWLGKIAGLSDVQRARWDNGTMGGRLRAIASDLGFYQIAESHGIDRAQADRCLNDAAVTKRLATQTAAATAAGVDATPGFAIDGVVLTGTYDWTMLAPQLQARL